LKTTLAFSACWHGLLWRGWFMACRTSMTREQVPDLWS
jgi:hypothetical protein